MGYQNIFDSHAHYDDSAFDEDREALLSALPEKGVCAVLDCGSDLPSSKKAVALAKTWPYLYAAAGVHPEEIGAAPAAWETELCALLDHKAENRIVAVGEIGLDYHFKENAPRDVQKAAFARQLEIAKAYNLPVVIHDRDAHGDTMELLRRYRPRGVLHCFSGSVEMMQEAVKLGLYIGLGGAVTFKNAKTPVRVAAAVPEDRLLNETDCPYMAPVPLRGTRCDSSMIPYSAEVIAAARGISAQAVLDLGCRNAKALFGIED